jgi:hypothetical protein
LLGGFSTPPLLLIRSSLLFAQQPKIVKACVRKRWRERAVESPWNPAEI